MRMQRINAQYIINTSVVIIVKKSKNKLEEKKKHSLYHFTVSNC